MIRERAWAAKKRFLASEKQKARPKQDAVYVSLDKDDVVIEEMTESVYGA
jgi:hypothetical protein